MNINVIIAVACLIFVTAALADWYTYPRAPSKAQAERQTALVCWHQVMTGRRATVADCPEL